MTSEQYNRMASALQRKPGLIAAILWANRIMTAIGFMAYPALLAWIVFVQFHHNTGKTISALAIYILGPGLAFVLLSLYRRKLNRPRPYEMLDIRPVISKDTSGQSFPSRHIFSMTLIAVLWCPFQPVLSVLLLIISMILSAIRVIGGVHFVRDVAAGYLIGAVSGALIHLIYMLF